MTRTDSRAQRFVKALWGPSLVALVGIASTGELAAMPVAPPGPQLPGPLLIQDSTGAPTAAPPAAAGPGEAARDETAPGSFNELHEALAAARERLEELSRAAEAVAASGQLQRELAALEEENQKLKGEVAAVRAERAKLETAQQAAEARAVEMADAAEQAKAKAQEIDQELVAMRWQNAQLNTSLAQSRTTRDQMAAEARQAEDALQSKIAELQAAAEKTTADMAQLREQSESGAQRVAEAERARAEVEAQLNETRERLEQTAQEKARLDEDLARVEAELATASEQRAAAEQDRAQLGERTAALQDERDGLRDRLAAVTQRLERTEAANGDLEREVAELREAAGAATDVARQNLMAVENRIRALNEALAAVGPAGGPLEADPALMAEARPPASAEQPEGEAPVPAAKVENVRAAAPEEAEPGGAEDDLARIKTASALHPPAEREGNGMLADLPLEQRLQVQGLLADLHSKLSEQGLMTTVPGELLFAVNSDVVRDDAYDTLAKVAELISVYGDRQVLIIGHSDAVGDAAYNKQLSERRAELVKQFLVDNFEIEAKRLSTQGWGEARPIAANTTPEGRRANRRVEVLILN